MASRRKSVVNSSRYFVANQISIIFLHAVWRPSCVVVMVENDDDDIMVMMIVMTNFPSGCQLPENSTLSSIWASAPFFYGWSFSSCIHHASQPASTSSSRTLRQTIAACPACCTGSTKACEPLTEPTHSCSELAVSGCLSSSVRDTKPHQHSTINKPPGKLHHYSRHSHILASQ